MHWAHHNTSPAEVHPWTSSFSLAKLAPEQRPKADDGARLDSSDRFCLSSFSRDGAIVAWIDGVARDQVRAFVGNSHRPLQLQETPIDHCNCRTSAPVPFMPLLQAPPPHWPSPELRRRCRHWTPTQLQDASELRSAAEREVFIIHFVIYGTLIHLIIFTIKSQIASCTNFNMVHCGCCRCCLFVPYLPFFFIYINGNKGMFVSRSEIIFSGITFLGILCPEMSFLSILWKNLFVSD